MVHFGPFWPKEVYFDLFGSANRTLATPDFDAMAEFLSERFLSGGCPNCSSGIHR